MSCSTLFLWLFLSFNSILKLATDTIRKRLLTGFFFFLVSTGDRTQSFKQCSPIVSRPARHPLLLSLRRRKRELRRGCLDSVVQKVPEGGDYIVTGCEVRMLGEGVRVRIDGRGNVDLEVQTNNLSMRKTHPAGPLQEFKISASHYYLKCQ